MKLYGDPGSGSSRRVSAVLYHVGADFDFELIDLFKGQNRTPAFLALNPNGLFPCLQMAIWLFTRRRQSTFTLSTSFIRTSYPRGMIAT